MNIKANSPHQEKSDNTRVNISRTVLDMCCPKESSVSVIYCWASFEQCQSKWLLPVCCFFPSFPLAPCQNAGEGAPGAIACIEQTEQMWEELTSLRYVTKFLTHSLQLVSCSFLTVTHCNLLFKLFKFSIQIYISINLKM